LDASNTVSQKALRYNEKVNTTKQIVETAMAHYSTMVYSNKKDLIICFRVYHLIRPKDGPDVESFATMMKIGFMSFCVPRIGYTP
jgi:hypothetical protein